MARTLSAQELADRADITDTLIRYANAIDGKDFDRLADVFTPDARIDYTSSDGIAGEYPRVRQWLEEALAPFPAYLHSLSNTSFEIEGDVAHTRTAFINPMAYDLPDGSRHTFTVYGCYVDRLVRTPDGWRIAERREEQGFMQGSLPPGLQIPD